MLDFKYPWSDFGSINLDFILNLCRETLGIHLDIDDHTLSLLNFEGQTISSVELPTEAIGDIAEMAKKDVNGKNLTSYAASLTYNSETNTLTLKSGANSTLAEIELNNGGGTDVVANPTGASTADLTKIKIGNVIYSIPTADLTDYYTKTQVDSKLSAKANVSDLAAVATSGSYNDLSNTPTIPAAQIQSDWNQADNTKKDYIKNKPSIPASQVQSDWNQSDNTAVDYIKNKPTIPTAQVQANWNESDTSSKAYIQNKPTIPDVPSSSGANAGDVLTHTVSGDSWLPVPKEIPTYTSADATKVLAVNSAGNNIEWATAGGGGVNPPSEDYFYLWSNWYLGCEDSTSTKWSPSRIPQFNYFSALDNYASDWAHGSFQTTADIAAGAEAEYLVVLPTPNDYDFTTYIWSTPYAMSNYQSTPTYLRMNGFSASGYGDPNIAQKTLIDNPYDSTDNPLYSFMDAILGAEDTQIWNTSCSMYNSKPIIEQTKIIYLTDYSSKLYRIQHVKIKNVSSSTLASGTTMINSAKAIKLMPTCAIYNEYTPT